MEHRRNLEGWLLIITIVLMTSTIFFASFYFLEREQFRSFKKEQTTNSSLRQVLGGGDCKIEDIQINMRAPEKKPLRHPGT